MSTRRHDYIPRAHAAFNNWFSNLFEYVSGWYRTWSIPEAEFQKLTQQLVLWGRAFTPTLGPHTPAQKVERNEARRAAEAVIRPFVQRYLMWPPVTDADRTNMNLPIRDTIPTEEPVPCSKVLRTFELGVCAIAQTPHIYSWSFAEQNS